MVTTRAQARKNYKEPDTDDDFGTPPPAPKKRRTRKNVSDNASKKKKPKATEPKDTKNRVTKSKATKSKTTKSKAAKSKAKESTVADSNAAESRVTRSKARQSKATESAPANSEAEEPKAKNCRVVKTGARKSKAAKSKATESKVTDFKTGEPKATKYRVVKTGTRKSEVPKPSGNSRRRRRSASPVLRGRPAATFSGLPSDIYALICEQATCSVYKPIPGTSSTSWRSHKYDDNYSSIARINHRMREIAPRTLLALNRSERATTWFSFYDALYLPRVLYLIAEAYDLSETWITGNREIPDSRPDWEQAQDSYPFAVGASIARYLEPEMYDHIYRSQAHGQHSVKLDETRRALLDHFPGEILRDAPRLSSREQRALRAFVERMVDRMRHPRHARGELEVQIILEDGIDPDWRTQNWADISDPDTNRRQLLRFLHAQQKYFREEFESIRFNFVIVDAQDPNDLIGFHNLWRGDAINDYRRLLTSEWWDDEPFEVGFSKMSPRELENEVLGWQQDQHLEYEEDQEHQEEEEEEEEEEKESLDLLEDLE